MKAQGLDLQCDWRFGMNLNPMGKATVGYLMYWSGCGGLSLAKDVEVWNPFEGPGQTVVNGPTVQCVGLIESFRFAGGESDPIRISAFVSGQTAAEVRSKLLRPLSNTKLKVGWYVIAFDDQKKAWYEAALLKTQKSAEALLDTVEGALEIAVDREPTPISESLDIKMFKFEFQVIPAQGRTTTLEFATGVAQRQVKTWAG